MLIMFIPYVWINIIDNFDGRRILGPCRVHSELINVITRVVTGKNREKYRNITQNRRLNAAGKRVINGPTRERERDHRVQIIGC